MAAAALLGGCDGGSTTALVEAGKASAAAGDHRGAALQFARAARELQGEPGAAQVQLLLGRAWLDGADPAAAVGPLTQALDSGMPPQQALPLLAHALWLTGQYRKLTTLYGERVFEGDRAATAALKTSLAAAWGALADAAHTGAAIDAALAAVPGHAPALVLNASIAAGRGDLQDASQQLDALLARQPSLASAWLLRGEIARQEGRAAEATQAFRQAIALEPAWMQARLAAVELELLAGDTGAAASAVLAMQAVQPAHPLTRFAQARLDSTRGDFASVRDLTQELLRGAPDDPDVLLMSALAEAQVGSLVIAEGRLQKALQIEPGGVPARVGLAQVQLWRGQPGSGRRTLEPLLDGVKAPSAQVLALAGRAEQLLGNQKLAHQFLARAAAAEPANSRYATEAVLAQPADQVGAVLLALEALSRQTLQPDPDRAIIALQLQRREPAAFAGALAAVDTLARKQPGAAEVPELRARVLMARDQAGHDNRPSDRKSARGALLQALSIDARRLAPQVALAQLDQLEGHPQAARDRLEAAVAAAPNDPAPRLALAAFDIRGAAPPDAIRATLAAAIQRAPAAAEPRLMLIEWLLGQGQNRAALEQAQDSLAALPDDVAVLEAAGRAQLAGAAVEQALNTFSRLVASAPGLAVPRALLADGLRLSGQTDAAEAAYRKALAIDPGLAAARVGLMQLLRASDSHSGERVTLARQQQQAAPADPAAYLAEAEAWLSLKDLPAATAAHQRGMAAGADPPRQARAWHAALLRHGRAGAARQVADQWLAAHPDDVAFELEAATAAVAHTDWPQAEARLTRLQQRQPAQPQVLNNLAWTLLMQGKPGALAPAQRAAEALPNRADVLDTLALALAAEGQPEQALVTQEAAVRLDPGDNRLRLTLAQVALQAGDSALARRELQRLKELGAGFARQADVSRLWRQL